MTITHNLCGKCLRESALGYDDGQIPEHHHTCHNRSTERGIPINDNLSAQIEDFRSMIAGNPEAGYSLTNGDILRYLEELLARREGADLVPESRVTSPSEDYHPDLEEEE